MTNEELRLWLEAQGFTIHKNHFSDKLNLCNWLASRKIRATIRDCESNPKKLCLIIHPFSTNLHGSCHVVEIEITGEYDSNWFKLQCYSLSPIEVVKNLETIEGRLISAWNCISDE